MASMPGILTEWPWTPLGSFKYVILAPWVAKSIYGFVVEGNNDLSTFLIFPFLLWRMLHNQLWISLSRYLAAKGNHRILDKGIEFDQVDRERNWDDQILLNGILFYIAAMTIPGATHLAIWRLDGVILTALIHTGPVEFLYYWLHRALHHHYLYSRYHSHHHSSIVTEPITSVIHPFAEHLAYFILFAIPQLTTLYTGTASVVSFAGYITYIDFMNNMGHCNLELIPTSLFYLFPPLKYFMYTPSYHSLHHTQFRSNYSLFMPLYDYAYGTMDKSSEALYQKSIGRGEELPDVVHLTHLTTPDSIYHLRLGFASLASRPHTHSAFYSNYYYYYYYYASKWVMWPITLCTMLFSWIYAPTSFVVERQRLHHLTSQTWVLPKYTFQYLLQWQRKSINGLIEEAILDAHKRGVKVLSLGLMNQGEELNRNGQVYIQRHPGIKTKLVDGSSLAVAIVLNTIPKSTTQVLFMGSLTKVAYALAFALCHKGIQVATTENEDYDKLKRSIDAKHQSNVVLSKSYTQKTWLVGDGLSDEEQKQATKGTHFIPFSQFPLKIMRKDCIYYNPPAMSVPQTVENVDSCENWLPRRVMSASRVAGIVHALEKWDEHECGCTISNIDKVWQATIKHGFKPLTVSTTKSYS